MRESLKDLRGKLVAWHGWETSQRHNRTWICISKAYVIQWDRNAAIQKIVEKKGGFYLDHFWLSGDKNTIEPQPIKLYNKVGGVGIVRTYMRKNGSIDYTIKMPSDLWNVESFIDLYNEEYKQTTPKQKIERLNEGLKHIKDHETNSEHILYGITRSISSLKNELLEEKRYIENSVNATEKALKTATMNGKCSKINLFKNKKIVKVKGF
tara:strand:+ start:1291 stop:1917 length:627 start_codon:yes stop_codon:yes gene_type:complete